MVTHIEQVHFRVNLFILLGALPLSKKEYRWKMCR